jgi:Dolichyl-phosphate-mannose-protein mannosyltransferase
MEQRSILPALDRLNPKIFFLLLFIYQVLFTFQGLDLSDEGFFGTFYQQMFHHPESVQYNFMFWLSGIVGSGFNYLFGDLGIWGLRLFSALITTGTIILTYNLLKNYINKTHLKIGLVIVTLFLSNNTKVFHYNYQSALLYILTVVFLFTGLQKNKLSKIFLAGVFVSLDTFTRIPSIVNLGLSIAIFYYGYINKTTFKQQLKQSGIFLGGFIVATGLVVLVMKLTGQLEYFLNALNLVFKMGSGGEDSYYGISRLFKQFVGTYLSTLKYTVFILVLMIAMAVGVNLAKDKPLYRKWIADLLKVFVILVVLALIYKNIIDHVIVLYFLTGLSLISGLLVLLSPYNKEIKTLMLMGCYILITYPLGSSAGLFIVGIYALWLVFPIAADYFFNIRSISSRFDLSGKIPFDIALFVSEKQFHQIRKLTVAICVIACLYQAYYYPFFDTHERTKMYYGVDNKYLKGIFTTKERATVVNELFRESKKYVKPGDYVLAYHSIPVFHYATKTIPYVRNSMPWFYAAGIFKEELDSALIRTNILPVVIAQKKKTVGNAGNWPEPPVFYDTAWHKKNEPRDSILNAFLQEHHYNEIWHNDIFKILLPPAKNPE